MIEFSQVYSVKSNARRAARAAGVDLAAVVDVSSGGWRFPLPGGTVATKSDGATMRRPVPPPAPRAFATYTAADKTLHATAKRAGLDPQAFALVELPRGDLMEYGFVPAADAGAYTLATMPDGARQAKPKTKAPAPAPKKKAAARRAGKARGAETSADKSATLIIMLKAAKGATVADLTKALGWLPHTLRARISGVKPALKKEGLVVERQRLLGVTWYKAVAKTAGKK